MFDAASEEVREKLAEQAYYRERLDEAAADAEHELDADTEYHCLAWGDLSDFARRPYRTAVATVCDAVLEAAVS